MRTTTLLLVLAIFGCSKKGDDTPATPVKAQEPAPPPSAPTPAPAPAKTDVGVTAGGIQHDAKEGPAGVLSKADGTVQVRRVGEAKFAAAKAGDNLYPGDLVRTADKSTATIALADHSVVEVAETSTVGIASRDGTADPASAAAVLAGIARFTVTPRAPAEGPFRVYTPSGFVVTKGTTYGVGVAADGEARVGVESGQVDVVGLAQQDADPVAVGTGNAATLDAKGTVAAPAAWPSDDWGTWRDDADAKLDVNAAVDAHGAALADLDKQLTDGYADLNTSADSAATFEANAAASADKNDTAAYVAAEPEGAATIDASFAVGGRLEALTWAYAGRAELASEIYERHPEVEPRWQVVAPRVDAAILWPKRYEVTATGYLEPLRLQYYVHEPRGRAHAELVGVAVPPFYAAAALPPIDPVRIRGHVKSHVWIAPEVPFKVQPRPVWALAPAPEWHAKLAVAPAPFRAKVGWYVRPPTPHATVFVGAPIKRPFEPHIEVRPPEPRAELRAQWKVPVGVKVQVGAPDFAAAERARATVKLDPGGRVIVREHAGVVVAPAVRAGVEVHGAPGVVVHGAPAVEVHGAPGVVVRPPEVRGGVDVRVHGAPAAEVREHAGAKVEVHAPAPPRVEVHAPPPPRVEVHAPEVKGKVEVKGGVKVEHR
jgi:hypothetical protein